MAVAMAAAALAASPAETQEALARSGEFTAHFSLVNPTPFPVIPVGDGRMVTFFTGVAAATNIAGSGFHHDFRGLCVLLFNANPSGGTFEAESYCDWQDRAGDHVYESIRTDGPQPFAGGAAVGRFVGGTGAYEGITGDTVIRPFGLTTGPAGHAQSVGLKTGNYQLP